VFEWFKRFKDWREVLQDDPRSERPSTSRNADTIANVRKMVTRDRRWALRMMAYVLNINNEAIRHVRPNAALFTTNPTCCPDANPGRRGGKPATNRLSYDTALINIYEAIYVSCKFSKYEICSPECYISSFVSQHRGIVLF
jgi:hypothetical protein